MVKRTSENVITSKRKLHILNVLLMDLFFPQNSLIKRLQIARSRYLRRNWCRMQFWGDRFVRKNLQNKIPSPPKEVSKAQIFDTLHYFSLIDPRSKDYRSLATAVFGEISIK
jgi:hypothetical protein